MTRLPVAVLWSITALFAAGAVYSGYLAFEYVDGRRWLWAAVSVVLALSVWRDVRILRNRQP
jgi:hypothetical protein